MIDYIVTVVVENPWLCLLGIVLMGGIIVLGCYMDHPEGGGPR